MRVGNPYLSDPYAISFPSISSQVDGVGKKTPVILWYAPLYHFGATVEWLSIGPRAHAACMDIAPYSQNSMSAAYSENFEA